MRETAKELAQLDGAFIISSDGIILSAARYICADSTGINLTLGLGEFKSAFLPDTDDCQAGYKTLSLNTRSDSEIIPNSSPWASTGALLTPTRHKSRAT